MLNSSVLEESEQSFSYADFSSCHLFDCNNFSHRGGGDFKCVCCFLWAERSLKLCLIGQIWGKSLRSSSPAGCLNLFNQICLVKWNWRFYYLFICGSELHASKVYQTKSNVLVAVRLHALSTEHDTPAINQPVHKSKQTNKTKATIVGLHHLCRAFLQSTREWQVDIKLTPKNICSCRLFDLHHGQMLGIYNGYGQKLLCVWYSQGCNHTALFCYES